MRSLFQVPTADCLCYSHMGKRKLENSLGLSEEDTNPFDGGSSLISHLLKAHLPIPSSGGWGGGRISTYEFQEKYNHSVHNLTLKLEGINLHVSFLSKSGQYVKITNGICCQNALMLPMIDINYRNTLQIGGLSAPRGQLFLHPGSPQAQGYN